MDRYQFVCWTALICVLMTVIVPIIVWATLAITGTIGHPLYVGVRYAGDIKSNTAFIDYSNDEFTVAKRFAYISASGIEGHLFLPTPVNACSYVDPPPGGFPVNSTWIALVYDYPSCPSDMVMNVRNAGYRLIIASSRNDSHPTVSAEVRDDLFPIVIVGEEYANYLKENTVSNSTTDPILVIVQASILNLMLYLLLACLSFFSTCIICIYMLSFLCIKFYRANKRPWPCCGIQRHLRDITHWRRNFVKKTSTTCETGMDNITINELPIASAEDFKEAALEAFKLHSENQDSALQLLSRYPDLVPTCSQQYPKFGMFLLLNACSNGWFDVVRMLVENHSCCDPNIKIYRPSICSSTICAFLLKVFASVANVVGTKFCHDYDAYESDTRVWVREQELKVSLNISDWSVIHCACKYGYLDIVKFLVEHGCDPACRNVFGATPLHFACWEGHLDVVTYLIGRGCNPVYTAVGLTPLHLACWKGHLDVVKFLLNIEKGFYSKCTNAAVHRLPPLHFACQKGKLDVVKLLIEQGIDPVSRDRKNYTPLHIACKEGHLDIVKFLVNEKRCNHLEPTVKGSSETPLHLANSHGHYLVSSFLTSPGVSRQARYEYMSRLSFPPVFKVFVMGNHSVGKSTLVQAIQNRLTSTNWFSLFTDQFKRVSGVKPDTAGIIPLSIDSKRLGNITMYDLAGHREYYSSHAAVLEKAVANPGSLLMVVVNLSENRDEIIRQLNYWNSFIENHCSQSGSKPDIVIVGSHADVVKSQLQKPKEKATEILTALPSSLQVPQEIIPINCTRLASDGLTELCAVIGNYCTLFRQEVTTDVNVNFLHALLCQEFKNVTARNVSTVLSSIEMGWDAETLSQYLVTLSDKSQFLYLRNAQNVKDGWMILDQEMLLKEINGTVFAPENFEEHYDDISSCTGVVPFSKIGEAFRDHDPEMIISFMSHLEFCHHIAESEALLISGGKSSGIQQQSEQLLEFCHIVPESDQEPLLNSCSEGESSSVQQQSDKLYFFPALVSNKDLPEESCKSINEKTHCKSGWSCQCIRSDQFLPPRFLHVLLLRLAFLFAIAPEPAEEDKPCPVIQRRCNVWKSGIHWLNRDGVEAIVEVLEQNTAVILIMGCLEGREMACIKHRSEVIRTILELRERFCRAVELRESFIHQDQLSYPVKSVRLLPSFTISELASTIAANQDILISQQGRCLTPCKISDLLYFEPYACFNPKLLAELFTNENSDKEASDVFYLEAGNVAHTKINLFKQALDINEKEFAVAVNTAPNQYKGCANHECYLLFHTWARWSPNPSYQALRSALDRCSVFCIRNPLLPAGLVPSLQHSVGTAREVHTSKPMLTRKSLDQDVLTPNELCDVFNELHGVRAKWYDLGLSMGVKEPDLAATRVSFHNIVNDCLREMLSHWLKVDPRPCWNAIVSALRKPIVEELQLAKALETKYCPAKPTAKPTTKPLDQHLAEPKAMKPVAQQDEDHSTVPHITEPMAQPTRKPDAQQDPAEDHSTVPYITKPMAKPRPTRKPVVQELTKRDQQDTTEDHSTVPHITDRPRPQELWCLQGRRGRVVKVVEAVAVEWVELAKTLHFDSSVIEHVREQFPQPEDACQEVLRRWLDGQEGTRQPVHWDTLIDSLLEAGFLNIAIDLQEAVEDYPIDVITTQL